MKEHARNNENAEIAHGLAEVFIQRWDFYPEQMEDGRYLCRHKPLTMDIVRQHLEGDRTLGAYVLDTDNRARYIVLDADDEQGFEALQLLALDYPCYLERSRRGGHLWFFFEEAVSGELARSFGKSLLNEMALEMELFPKQAASEGPGSLVRMPFGIHRKSGERYPFIWPDGTWLGSWAEQQRVLSNPERICLAVIEELAQGGDRGERRQKRESDKVWDRIKSSTNVMDFISRYVDLRETGSGGVGRCPFHEDQHPSFSVNRDANFWNCFAGCGGGSIIDFWMKWNNVDFQTATGELARMLGVDDG